MAPNEGCRPNDDGGTRSRDRGDSSRHRDADRLQSDAEGFTQLLTEDVALVNFGGRRVLGRSNVHRAMRQALDTPFAHV
jgi:hypothetical protein